MIYKDTSTLILVSDNPELLSSFPSEWKGWSNMKTAEGEVGVGVGRWEGDALGIRK